MLDLRLPDMSGIELLEKLDGETGLKDLPVIVYTGKDLNQDEETKLKALSRLIISKDARSMERLLDETDAFLSKFEASEPRPSAPGSRAADGSSRPSEPVLEGKLAF